MTRPWTDVLRFFRDFQIQTCWNAHLSWSSWSWVPFHVHFMIAISCPPSRSRWEIYSSSLIGPDFPWISHMDFPWIFHPFPMKYDVPFSNPFPMMSHDFINDVPWFPTMFIHFPTKIFPWFHILWYYVPSPIFPPCFIHFIFHFSRSMFPFVIFWLFDRRTVGSSPRSVASKDSTQASSRIKKYGSPW